MKKSLVIGILGLAAVAASSYGQGCIWLDNYFSNGGDGGPIFTYGVGVPVNGVSGAVGTPGAGLLSGWTAGIYFAVGTPNIIDPAGVGMPNAALSLGTGPGSTASFQTSAFGVPGEFEASQPFNTGAPVGSTITLEIVAYPTPAGSYAAAIYRMHTSPFTMPTAENTNEPWTNSPSSFVGDAMIAAGITGQFPVQIPEPGSLALIGLTSLSLLLARRKEA